MAGLLNIGLTGLNAAQGQLSTTSHNITNAGTPGYNRQTVVQTTLDPLFSGAGFFGQGTRITAVEREYSQFLENQVLSADNRRIEYATYAGQISQINNLLADATVGLSPAMQEFFAGVQEVAANPTSVPARQSLISTASAMVSRFQALDERITEVRNGVEGQIRVAVDSINVLADKIGEMNRQIVVAQAAGAGVPANDLLDRRNHLISELNQLIKVSTVDNGDGQVNVFVGSGQPLVLG
ncbi:MAG: flagellar hook-associated protein FlgK [Rhodocyclaceae bacterium]